jgi:hypothetical protein
LGADAEAIRLAMNQALLERPEVAVVLAISGVLPASEADYEVLLDYQRQAASLGLARFSYSRTVYQSVF